MKIGYIYPQFELSRDPSALGALGQAADALGYDHMMMFDHVAGADHTNRQPPLTGPFDYTHPFHDPFVAIGYLAGITKRIAFATGVVILPQRQTVLVARQTADIDLLSGGRFRLGTVHHRPFDGDGPLPFLLSSCPAPSQFPAGLEICLPGGLGA